MIKNILKVLYIAFGLIMAFLIYLIGYRSNIYNHIQDLTATAIAEKNYVDVGMIHGGCFEKNNLVVEDSDQLDLVIFPSTTLVSLSYYTDEKNTTVVNSYDKSYYVYIFYPTFETMDIKTNKLVNSAGIRFKSINGSYDYVFKISDTVNEDRYIAKPTSAKEVLLNSERNVYSWEFYNITLTESLIEAMSDSLKGDIVSLSVLDSSGAEVYSVDVALDFSQTFFTDVQPLVDHYNTYLEEYNSDDKAIRENAVSKFDEFYLGTEDTEGFEKTFQANENYTFRYPDSYLQPSKLIWQTVGILALFVICMLLFYVLLFHFAFIKRLVSREGRQNYRRNPGASRRNVIEAKVVNDTNQKNEKKHGAGKAESEKPNAKPQEPVSLPEASQPKAEEEAPKEE